MRISDWSSDVCSSDLLGLRPAPQRRTGLGLHNVAVPTERSCLRANALQEGFLRHSRRRRRTIADARFQFLSVLGLGGALRVRPRRRAPELRLVDVAMGVWWPIRSAPEIGRESCRGGVCQYGEISGVAVSLEKIHKMKQGNKK